MLALSPGVVGLQAIASGACIAGGQQGAFVVVSRRFVSSPEGAIERVRACAPR